MKYSSDFRAHARHALKGHWFIAVITGLIATLLGGASSTATSSFSLNIGASQSATILPHMDSRAVALFLAVFIPVMLIAMLFSLLYIALASVVSVGYAQFNLSLVDGREAQPDDLFAHFSNFKTLFCARLLMMLYTFLWSLLFIIPGIIASYSYAMVPYLLSEYPDMAAREAITYSKELMYGNRWRLFCLHFSFIGWSFLCVLTLGIGNLWLSPYRHAAEAAFYRDLIIQAGQTAEIPESTAW